AAVAVRETLFDREPNEPSRRGQVAQAWHNLGALFRATDRPADAERAFTKVLSLLQQPDAAAAAAPPVSPRNVQLRGQAWNSLGLMHNAAGRFADAEAAFLKAISVKEQLVATYPSLPEYRCELA